VSAETPVVRLEIRKGKSPFFYGLFETNGKRHRLSLKIPVEGTPPHDLRARGDEAFERSRTRAIAKYIQLKQQLLAKSAEVHLLESLYRIRTGDEPASISIDGIFARWSKPTGKKPRSERYVAVAESTFLRFSKFMQGTFPQIRTMGDVRTKHATAFLESEWARGISAKTYNDVLKLLRSAFKRLAEEASITSNPFESHERKDLDTVHRVCFSERELTKITAEAKRDAFIGPIVITALSTGMRRGDCCCLPWNAVDLKNRIMRVKTLKRGITAEIPIFPNLYRVLKAQQKAHAEKRSAFVFPEQQTMYCINPDGITLRVKALLQRAGVRTDEDVAAPTGQRLRKPSRRATHAFRTTWTTTALTSGVPIALVQKVVGVHTVAVVQQNYLQPDSGHYLDAFKKLPRAITG